jgi:BON domain-containing protein
MRGSGKLLSGVLLGAGAMYLLDPDRGARRRSLMRDQGLRASRKLGQGARAAARDVRNRSAGAAAGLTSRMKRDQAADQIVQERVRAALGRVASHASPIDVSVYNRRVILSGPVPAAELDSILRSIRRVRGVREVENQLKVYDQTDAVPALQASGRPRLGRTSLTPATRLLMGTLGSAAAVAGVKTRGGLGTVLSVLGLAAVAQALLNLSIDRVSQPEQSEVAGANESDVAEGYQVRSASPPIESSRSAPE